MNARPVTLQVKRRFDAAPERVFDAWLDPDIVSRWLFTTPNSRISRADIDPRVGGRFSIVDSREDGDIEHVGEYLVIDRPRRLVFTFAVPQFSPEYDRVTIEIARLDKGCELTLTSEMTPEIFAEWGERTRQGWTMMLERLSGSLDA